MDDRAFLKFELVCLLLVTNLIAFSLGMLLPMINFEVGKFLYGLQIYHWSGIVIGLAVFFAGTYDLVKRFNRVM